MGMQHPSVAWIGRSKPDDIQVMYVEVSDDGKNWHAIQRITERDAAWREIQQPPDAPHWRLQFCYESMSPD